MKKYFLAAYLIVANESAYDPKIPTEEDYPNEELINTAPTRVPDKDNGVSDGALIEKEEQPEDVIDKKEKKKGKISPPGVY